LRVILGAIAGVIAVFALWYGYAYATSPAAIRHPAQAHFHFRLQVINGGTPVNFADAKFQTEFNKDICTAAITKEPVHFHDGVDQFVHIHWAGLTGGIVLKQYGWNFIGGTDGTLGYQFNGLHWPERVSIHGQALPQPPKDAKYYVYVGTAEHFQERSWTDFLKSDLRQFFDGTPVTASVLDRLVPTASAHSDEEHLAQLNDVVGNVVIFAQKDKPTDQQVKDRFTHLIPLPESACAG
jgi:hypothetical protein